MAAIRQFATPRILYKREYREENKDKLNRQQRDSYAKNRDEKCAQNRKRYLASDSSKIYHRNCATENYERNKKWLKENRDIKCKRCGYDEFFCSIDGHHLNPSQKKNNNDLLTKWLRRLSLKSFIKKIEETDLMFLCRNCHTGLCFGKWDINDIRGGI
jgi:hypothetical protein